MQLIGIGVLGEYIGRIYLETKHRPRYIIKEMIREVGSSPGMNHDAVAPCGQNQLFTCNP